MSATVFDVCVHVLRLCCAKLLHQFCLCVLSHCHCSLSCQREALRTHLKISAHYCEAYLLAQELSGAEQTIIIRYTRINMKICFIAYCYKLVALRDKQHAITHIRDYWTRYILSSNGI